MGGLCYSTKDVYEICFTTEMSIRHLVNISGSKSLSSKYNYTYITVNTLKLFMDKRIYWHNPACI